MKISLVVASGVHAGKAIPVTAPQFVIGRDPQCQLRPASPSISKRHCAVFVRGRQVLIRDFGSTNGTFVNDKLVEGEVELHDGDAVKVGPLDFKISLSTADAPPKPTSKPAPAVTVGGEPDSADTVVLSGPKSARPSSDMLAADLLLEDDGSSRKSGNTLDSEAIPEGSTIMDVPAEAKPKDGAPAPAAKKPAPANASTSDAAAEILKRYQRRPRS